MKKSSESDQICELAFKISQIVLALNGAPINKAPGAWTHEMTGNWFLAANGHNEPVEIASTPERMGFTLRPFDFAVWKNGWLAANFNTQGVGVLLINEDDLIAVADAELQQLEGLKRG